MPRRNGGPRLQFLKKRGCWYIVGSKNGRSWQRSTGTKDGAQAALMLAEFINAQRRKSGPSDPSQVLVTDIIADYCEERAPETQAPWRIAAAAKPLIDYWEGRTVAEVTRETCQRYAKVRQRSAGTIRRELGVLRAAINHSHKSGRLTRFISIELPQPPQPRDRRLTRKDAAILLHEALREPRVRLHLPLFIVLGLYTGRRKEAILSLRWAQVDLDAGRIDFNKSGAQRTNKRRGHIPIPLKLLGHLRRARRRSTQLGFVVHENGRALKDIKRGFKTAVQRAGLSDVTPHTLRHTCATWLMQRGVPLWDAAGYLAMTPETLQRVYGHHHPDYLKQALKAFS
jgi:integrase